MLLQTPELRKGEVQTLSTFSHVPIVRPMCTHAMRIVLLVEVKTNNSKIEYWSISGEGSKQLLCRFKSLVNSNGWLLSN